MTDMLETLNDANNFKQRNPNFNFDDKRETFSFPPVARYRSFYNRIFFSFHADVKFTLNMLKYICNIHITA